LILSVEDRWKRWGERKRSRKSRR